MTDLEKLAAAVLMFHDSEPWTLEHARKWRELTGSGEATSKDLCDFARSLVIPPKPPC